jgi:hypothetical protein
MNTFAFINAAYPGFIIKDCINGTDFPAWTLLMDNRAEGTGFRAHPAGFAPGRIDPHFGIAGRDGIKPA